MNHEIKQSLEQSIEIAIVDGINIFVRDVLAEQGYITPEKFDDTSSKHVLQQKYAIAKELAEKWGRFLRAENRNL